MADLDGHGIADVAGRGDLQRGAALREEHDVRVAGVTEVGVDALFVTASIFGVNGRERDRLTGFII